MAMQRWTPWQEWQRMQDELARTFERVFGGREAMMPAMPTTWMPATDVFEEGNKIVVTMDLPGVNPDDIHISVTDNTLRVRGERKQEKETKEENIYRMERMYGSFERVITLPSDVKSEDIEATYKDGTLRIELPKAEEKKGKEIKIKAA